MEDGPNASTTKQTRGEESNLQTLEKIRFRKSLFFLVSTLALIGGAIIAFHLVSEYRMSQTDHQRSMTTEWTIDEERLTNSCENRSGIELIICATIAFEEAKAEQRDELDLAAQQDMAFWALLLLLLTWLGVLLSAISVAALVWTFWKTREQSRVETVAYLISQKCVVGKIWDRDDPNFFQLDIGFEIHNSGNTPAFDMTIVSRIGWSTLDRIQKWQPESAPTSRGLLGPGQSMQQSRRLEINFEDWMINDNIEEGATIWIRGVVQYRDVYDQRWEHTFAWRLVNPELLRNSDVSKPEDKKFLDFGMSLHESLNDLKRVS